MVASRISLIRAPNPSPLTLSGTNSYLIDSAQGEAICIDPGPPIPSHIDALEEKARQLHSKIVAVALTHSHPDHAPAAERLARDTGAIVYAHAGSAAKHDRDLKDGDRVRVASLELLTIEAPGHTGDHLVFYEPNERALFTGDTVLGEGYVIVAPPHGDMRAYQRTLKRLLTEFPQARVLYGGHGDPVFHPADKIRDYIQHREMRENELVRALRNGPKTIPELLEHVYAQTSRTLWPAAARQMLAYLRALENEGRVRSSEIARPLDSQEAAILNPDLAALVGPDQAKVVEAELGSQMHIGNLFRYELT